jgi:hypothetical protein
MAADPSEQQRFMSQSPAQVSICLSGHKNKPGGGDPARLFSEKLSEFGKKSWGGWADC